MEKYKVYYCEKCDKEYNFMSGKPFSTICPKCHAEMEYLNDLTKEEVNKFLNNDIELKDVYQDVHSIKNMILFFTILTVLNLIASFIMLMAR